MDGPTWKSETGIEMSLKGGANFEKNGGAHTVTHGSSILVNSNEVQTVFSSKVPYLNERGGAEIIYVVQNGGHESGEAAAANADSTSLAESEYAELPTPADDIAGSPVVEEAVSALGQAIDGENIEWIKATVDNELGRITFDPIGAIREAAIDGLDMGDKTSRIEFGDLFTSSAVNCSLTSADSAALGTCSVSSVTPNMITACQIVRTSVGASRNTQSSPSSPRQCYRSGKLRLQRSRSYSDSDDNRLSLQDRACLEEIERGSQMTQEERELFENSRQELQAMDFNSLQDKSNMLMTAQELESMPDDGLEFEASVGPKQHLLGLKDDIQIVNIPDMLLDNDNASAALTDDELINNALQHATVDGNADMQSVLKASLADIQLASQDDDDVDDDDDGTQTKECSSIVSLAVSSAPSDDPDNPTTQLIVNSGANQQVFHICSSDLAKLQQNGESPLSLLSVDTESLAGLSVQDGNYRFIVSASLL